jgi:hypothetical protein
MYTSAMACVKCQGPQVEDQFNAACQANSTSNADAAASSAAGKPNAGSRTAASVVAVVGAAVAGYAML